MKRGRSLAVKTGRRKQSLGRGWQYRRLSDRHASDLTMQEAEQRSQLMSDELREVELAVWAWKALQQGRVFCFVSRMRRMALSIPAARRLTKDDDDSAIRSVLNHRQRAMAAVVLAALTDPGTHQRQQLEEIGRGCGGLRIAPLESLDMDVNHLTATVY